MLAVLFYGDFKEPPVIDRDVFFSVWDDRSPIKHSEYIQEAKRKGLIDTISRLYPSSKVIVESSMVSRGFNECDDEYLINRGLSIIGPEYTHVLCIKMERPSRGYIIELFIKDCEKYDLNNEVIVDGNMRYMRTTDFSGPELSLTPKTTTDFNICDQIAGSKKCLVVVRYNEDVSWVLGLKKSSFDKIVIIDKGKIPVRFISDDRHIVIKVPNIRREAHSYNQFIYNCYDCLPERTTFCQGDPFVHSPDFLSLIEKEQQAKYTPFQSLTVQYDSDEPGPNEHKKSQFINGYQVSSYYVDTKTQHIVPKTKSHIFAKHALNMRTIYDTDLTSYVCDYLGLDKPKRYIDFVYGAMFCVTRDLIRRHDRRFYAKLGSYLNTTYHTDWVMEYYWAYLFTGKSYGLRHIPDAVAGS